MGQNPFSKPVFLKLHHTGNFQARSPWEAFEYLDLHWPEAHAAHYRRAKAVCRAAMDGLVRPEEARRVLIDAAKRARLLARKWEVDDRPVNTVYVATPAAQLAEAQP